MAMMRLMGRGTWVGVAAGLVVGGLALGAMAQDKTAACGMRPRRRMRRWW